eukprot:TRINITY_DN3765_c0_g3_i1.p1 TRINITY_DN3765_c0_g3~~TRINITY_DN3765_c0_g3_i1.p1  ORF type:complete len:173 (+),score=7.25 TRINITY_DN3765_c0_g3_i1:131-649(+)
MPSHSLLAPRFPCLLTVFLHKPKEEGGRGKKEKRKKREGEERGEKKIQPHFSFSEKKPSLVVLPSPLPLYYCLFLPDFPTPLRFISPPFPPPPPFFPPPPPPFFFFFFPSPPPPPPPLLSRGGKIKETKILLSFFLKKRYRQLLFLSVFWGSVSPLGTRHKKKWNDRDKRKT